MNTDLSGVRYYLISMVIILMLILGCSGSDERIRQFAGVYEGTYSGDSSGSWTAEITFKGVVEANIIDGSGGEIYGRGSISPTGELSLDTSGRVMDMSAFATWQGKFALIQGVVYGEGTWSAGEGYVGTWEGKKVRDFE